MRNVLFLIIYSLCGFTTLAQQKKKPKRALPPPRIKVSAPVDEPGVKSSAPADWTIAPPSLPKTQPRKEIIVDSLKVPANTNRCACNNIDLMVGNFFEQGMSDPTHNLKGRVAKIITTEKRDTTVGYWETLSLGNVATTRFTKSGRVLDYFMRTTDRFSGSEGLATKMHFAYNAMDKPTSLELYFIDTVKPVTTLVFNYTTADGLHTIKSTADSTIIARQQDKKWEELFICSENDTVFTISRYEYTNGFNSEAHLLVYNKKRQLVQKQDIEHKKDMGSRNKTVFFAYNAAGQKTSKSILKEDGSKSVVVTYRYDAQNNLIKEEFDNGDYTVYKYKYDAQNNWVWQQKTEYETSNFSDKMEVGSRITWDRAISYY